MNKYNQHQASILKELLRALAGTMTLHFIRRTKGMCHSHVLKAKVNLKYKSSLNTFCQASPTMGSAADTGVRETWLLVTWYCQNLKV